VRQFSLASSYPDQQLGREVPYEVPRVPAGFLMMYVAGLISGLLGIGSGSFKVLVMDTAMRLPMKVSTTTSNFMIGVPAAASAGISFERGDIHPLWQLPWRWAYYWGQQWGQGRWPDSPTPLGRFRCKNADEAGKLCFIV
jgi:Sulfite exporter TauE/SafE